MVLTGQWASTGSKTRAIFYADSNVCWNEPGGASRDLRGGSSTLDCVHVLSWPSFGLCARTGKMPENRITNTGSALH